MTFSSVRAGVALAMLGALVNADAAPSDISLETARRALAAGDAASALRQYEALNQQGESLEVELGLIRAALQVGEFRKAMSWANLTAGEHKDSAEAIGLVAFLHDRIGRTEHARAMLKEWHADHPQHRNHELTGPRPSFEAFPVSARQTVVGGGNGIVVDGGRHVLTYAGLLPDKAVIYVRNGLGKVRRAVRAPGNREGQLVRLRLEQPYPGAWSFPEDRMIAPEGTRFCFTFSYNTPRDPVGAYPAVAPGIVFRADAGVGGLMQITSATHSGNGGDPVFDARGRLLGISVGSGNIMAGSENLRPRVGAGHFAVRVAAAPSGEGKSAAPLRPAGPLPPMPAIEELYEQLTPSIVQIIAVEQS